MDNQQKLRDALRLPLLFHKGGEWTSADSELWDSIVGPGYSEVTTKVMCDHIRKVLDE